MDSWVGWSEDQRVTSAWYLEPHPLGWRVGYSRNGQLEAIEAFEDSATATATFIDRTLRDVKPRR
jgi:hypothetical protein